VNELERHRREQRTQALRNLGLSAELSRSFAGQVRQTQDEARLARLPVDASQRVPLQDVGGDPFFFIGIDDIGVGNIGP
jgi:hypothetical protein